MVNVRQAVGTAVSEDSLFIPLIDLSLFFHGSETDKFTVGNGMASGFKDAGFVYIKNHGIPQDVIDRVFSESAKFFRRPKDQKDALAWTTPESNRGYVAHGREKVTQLSDKSIIEELRAKNPDLKESIEIGRDDVPGLPNNWPDRFDSEGVEFKTVMKDFFDKCKELHVIVMRSIALGMGLGEHFFDKFCDAGDNTLRLLHYPAQPTDVFKKNEGQVRAGKHTDYGTITLLFQDDRGGLQVRSPEGTFVNATPIPGTIIINAGDLLARWSNNKIHSTEHQVVEPPVAPDSDEYPARYSCAYFCNPNFDAFIEALPGTYGSEEEKIYPGINSGEYLVQRLGSTYY
ncbi:hypothetical protein RUND412_002797 [Rhizina undulata]